MEYHTLLVRLINSNDPVITRLLSVPSTFTFSELHDVLQIAFGWANSHAYRFVLSKLLEKGEVSFLALLRPCLRFIADDSVFVK